MTLILVYCVLSLYVNASDSDLEETDLCAVAACFYNAGLFLDADYLTDDTTDRCNLIANLEIVTHVCDLLLLLLLLFGADDHEYDHNAYDKEHGEHGKELFACRGSAC